MESYDLIQEMEALLSEEDEPVSTLANAAALLFERLDRVNWAGFYLLRGEALALGPFCGRPACTRIAPGRGVCGTAFQKNETICVPDVHAFPGHIACDCASNAELVIPLRGADGAPFGVLDLDSPVKGRFTAADAAALEEVARIVERKLARGQ